jgi:hypothetical protein
MWTLLVCLAIAADEPADETLVVESGAVEAAREAVAQALEAQGYVRQVDKGDRVIFKSETPWKPQVVVFDDGWMVSRTQPPRLHAPNQAFADEGNPLGYLLCVYAPHKCVSLGTLSVSRRKVLGQETRLADALDGELDALNQVVVGERTRRRLDVELPAQCEALWARSDLSAAERRRGLFELWDSRTDTPAGEAARDVIQAFLVGEVQPSTEPYTDDEIVRFNKERRAGRPFLGGVGGQEERQIPQFGSEG